MWVVNYRVRRAGADDFAVVSDLYRRSSLSNDGDRESFLANPRGAANASGCRILMPQTDCSMTYGPARSRWRRGCERSPLPTKRTETWTLRAVASFHDLPHTAATLLLGAGIHPKVVSEMLGHSTTAITLDLYSHVTPTMQQQAADAVDSVLGRQVGRQTGTDERVCPDGAASSTGRASGF